MFDDLDPLDRMMSSDPADSAHANGARLSWRAGDGVYADTFGRLQFTAPQAPYSSDNAALAALVDAVTAQVAAMDEASRIALFANLKRDKQNDLKGAGIVFPTDKYSLAYQERVRLYARVADLPEVSIADSPVAAAHGQTSQ